MYVLYLLSMCVDPVDGIKGKTWGPSTMQKNRYRSTSSVLANDRCCKSAPNIQKTLCRLGGHSNIGALQELGKFFQSNYIVGMSVQLSGKKDHNCRQFSLVINHRYPQE